MSGCYMKKSYGLGPITLVWQIRKYSKFKRKIYFDHSQQKFKVNCISYRYIIWIFSGLIDWLVLNTTYRPFVFFPGSQFLLMVEARVLEVAPQHSAGKLKVPINQDLSHCHIQGLNSKPQCWQISETVDLLL